MAWERVRTIPRELKDILETVEIETSTGALRLVLKKGFITDRAKELPPLVVSKKTVQTGSESSILKEIYDSATSIAGRIFRKTGVIQSQIRKFAKDFGFDNLSESLVNLYDEAMNNTGALKKPLEDLLKKSPSGTVSVEAIMGSNGAKIFIDGIKLVELKTDTSKRCSLLIVGVIKEYLSKSAVPVTRTRDEGDSEPDLKRARK